jgi:hypothetical protein
MFLRGVGRCGNALGIAVKTDDVTSGRESRGVNRPSAQEVAKPKVIGPLRRSSWLAPGLLPEGRQGFSNRRGSRHAGHFDVKRPPCRSATRESPEVFEEVCVHIGLAGTPHSEIEASGQCDLDKLGQDLLLRAARVRRHHRLPQTDSAIAAGDFGVGIDVEPGGFQAPARMLQKKTILE